MDYRIDKEGLFSELGAWDGFLKKKVHLIACGGTALTLMGVKPSTKDVDLIIPDLKEYDYLVKIKIASSKKCNNKVCQKKSSNN